MGPVARQVDVIENAWPERPDRDLASPTLGREGIDDGQPEPLGHEGASRIAEVGLVACLDVHPRLVKAPIDGLAGPVLPPERDQDLTSDLRRLDADADLQRVADAYTTLLRGVPDLLVIYLFYFGSSAVLTPVGRLVGV